MELSDLSEIPQSTAPAVRTYLFNTLSSVLPADPDNQYSLYVCYDDPGEYEADDIVSIGDVSLEYEPGAMVGSGDAGWLRERYSVHVLVDVFRGGDNALLTFNRAQYLSDLICAAVRYDVSLDGLVVTATPKSSNVESEWDDDHKGRHSVASVEISCYASR